MKNLLSALVLLLGAAAANAQVGVGTSSPNASAQLEIVSEDKGILIPQVSLTDTTDATTITNGNVSSLLVYNTSQTADVNPGYYYWFDNKWNRILTDLDIFNETITTLVDNGNGTYTYTSEDGVVTVIDIPGNQTLTTLVYDQTANTLTYTDENNNPVVIDLPTLVQNAETLTSLVKNEDGSITYTDENGNQTNIDLTGIIQDNQAVTSIVANINAGTITFTNELGETTVINISDFVTQYETVTTLVDNGDGTVTYTNEEGTAVTVTLPAGLNGVDGTDGLSAYELW
ncbi:hypothetical protein Q763_14730, partial [Flavobacterium beibuense F44-8]